MYINNIPIRGKQIKLKQKISTEYLKNMFKYIHLCVLLLITVLNLKIVHFTRFIVNDTYKFTARFFF